jgi:ribosomal protein L4
LVIFDKKDENMTKSFRNISSLKLLSVDYLNPYDIMNSDKMVFVGSALEKIN